MHHPLARINSQEYIRRPKSVQGIHKCPSPISLYSSIDVDFHSPRPTDLSPLVDFSFSLDQVVRSSSVSNGILRPRRNTNSGITSNQNIQTSQRKPLQSAFRTRSMSTSQNVFSRVQDKEQLGPRTSCPNPANLKLRPFNSFITSPFIPLSKASVSLSDNDISLLWTRSKCKDDKTNNSDHYSLKVKHWYTSRAERLNATMAPKANPFSNAPMNFVEFSWYNNSHYTRSADKCRGCQGDFFQQEPCLLHDNRLWHYGCLRCDQCDHEIIPNTFYLCPIDSDVKLSEAKPVFSCTQSLGRKRKHSFSPEYWKDAAKVLCSSCVPACHVCIQSVLHDHVMALGKHWHRECFRCSTCGDPLGDNIKVYGKRSDICCSRCIQPLFGQSLTNPKMLRSALSIESEDGTPLDEAFTSSTGGMCRENSQLFSGVSDMASAFAYALSEHNEKNEILLPETHRNYSENLNAFLTHNSLDRRHLKEKKRQKNAMMNLTNSFKSEKTVACPIGAPSVSTSLSSYNTIINSHEGRSLLLDYCVEKCEIEKIYFITDIEALKDFDTEELDWLVFVRKLYKLYIAPEAEPEMLVNLPKDIADDIRDKIRAKTCSMGIFDKAREFVLNHIEKNIVNSFLKSSYGSQYLKALVSFDNVSRQVIRSISKHVNKLQIELNVIGYDKRHDTKRPKGKSKYYVYEIEVKIGEYAFTVFRAYREFYSLHETMKKEFPKQIPPFPHKMYLRRSEVKSIAKQRASDLNLYLQELLSKKPEISKHQELLTFIKQTDTDVKDEEFNRFLFKHGVLSSY